MPLSNPESVIIESSLASTRCVHETTLPLTPLPKKRRYGSVIGGFSDVSFDRSDFENLDHASEAIDVFQIGDDWIPISRDELLTGLTRLIAYDYGI